MSEEKHTPGPWETQTHISLDRLEIRDADGRRIAECAMDFPMSAKTHDANAHLIAAAPDLLEALKDCCVIARPGNPSSCCPVYRPGEHGGCAENECVECDIWKAIQKARGGDWGKHYGAFG